MVHTFHIGFGQDLAASCVVWLARLFIFGRGPIDERLRSAFSSFQEFCHAEKRYTSCDEWNLKKLGMSEIQDCNRYARFLISSQLLLKHVCPDMLEKSKLWNVQ